jgi:hypothetical protein
MVTPSVSALTARASPKHWTGWKIDKAPYFLAPHFQQTEVPLKAPDCISANLAASFSPFITRR